MAYDQTNIFARILRGEIPCNKVYEDDYALAFHDINPQAAVHVLVIPKGPYTNFSTFASQASAAEIAGFIKATGHVAQELGLTNQGYRLLSNEGLNGGQEVPHLHYHLVGGQPLGRMLQVSADS